MHVSIVIMSFVQFPYDVEECDFGVNLVRFKFSQYLFLLCVPGPGPGRLP